MKKTPVNQMMELVNFLPNKDISIAKKFINSRQFRSLKDLVDSAIIKVERNNRSSNPKEIYNNIDLDSLGDLSDIVDDYLLLLGEDTETTYNELEEEDITEDEWN